MFAQLRHRPPRFRGMFIAPQDPVPIPRPHPRFPEPGSHEAALPAPELLHRWNHTASGLSSGFLPLMCFQAGPSPVPALPPLTPALQAHRNGW